MNESKEFELLSMGADGQRIDMCTGNLSSAFAQIEIHN